MIKTKSLFSGWHEATKEQAKEFAKFLMSSITNMAEKEKVEYINKNKLQGITVEELLKEGGTNGV